MNHAVFLDKDGTLIRNDPYNVIPEKIEFMPGVLEELPRLSHAGYRLIIVSNQAGIALGHFEEAALAGVERWLDQRIRSAGASLDGFYYCPHHPDATRPAYRRNCTCRKPGAGLLLQAAEDHQIDLTRSWLIGDILDDIQAGKEAGCKTILINNGNETEWIVTPLRTPDFRTPHFKEACRHIIGNDVDGSHGDGD